MQVRSNIPIWTVEEYHDTTTPTVPGGRVSPDRSNSLPLKPHSNSSPSITHVRSDVSQKLKNLDFFVKQQQHENFGSNNSLSPNLLWSSLRRNSAPDGSSKEKQMMDRSGDQSEIKNRMSRCCEDSMIRCSDVTCSIVREENARFVILAIFILFYLLFGALVFQYLEEETEVTAKKVTNAKIAEELTIIKYCLKPGNCSLDRVLDLMYR